MTDPRTIGDIFDGDLERTINDIVKLGDGDERVVAVEIGEYEVTHDIEQRFASVLRQIATGMASGEEQKVGFWVSGFYGSGKSSFVKVLSYAVENKKLGGRPSSELFLERTGGGAELREALRAIVERRPAVVRFDLQGDRDLTSLDEPFTSIAYRALRRTLGYAESPRLAALEIRLDEEGKLEDFRRRYATVRTTDRGV